MAGNEVRIIGGKWKGRKLRFPAVNDIRPTLGRARESLFNWLVADVPGARCLDLFAGSGALGFEALSRGAAHVTFVESNRKVASALRSNIDLLEAGNASVRTMSAKRFLLGAQSAWDIIFLDPPFGSGEFRQAATLIAQRDLLQPKGFVYFELPRKQPLGKLERWELARDSHAGDTQFGLLCLTQGQTRDHTLSV